MASTPDAHPDSVPPRESESPEQVSPLGTPERETVEDLPDQPTDSPGMDGGTGGTGGTNHAQDHDVTS